MEEKDEIRGTSDSLATLNLDSSSEMEAHLDSINKAIEEINTLSTDFLTSREEFIKAYGEAKHRLAKLYVSNKKIVDKARPFYQARDEAYRVKYKHRKSAAWLKKCCEECAAARQVAQEVEDALLSSASSGSGGTSDLDLLGKLNKANDLVAETKKVQDLADTEQKICMQELSRADGHLANLAQHHSQHVLKASSYFEARDKMQRHLDFQYTKLWDKNKRLQEVKQKHREMFTQFSSITTGVTKIQTCDDFKSEPPDLSMFEEIEDVDSLDSSFQGVKGDHMIVEDKNYSDRSASHLRNSSHVTKPANIVSLDEMVKLDLSAELDSQQSTEQQEIFIDYGVSFEMDV